MSSSTYFYGASLIVHSAVFQAGGLIVVLVEVGRKAYLASIVPVIVNAILNEHQIVVDIVAFVNRGDFPRSRLGEKQRGKILASWVTRKMRTMAQFGIRDAESTLSDVTETIEPRVGDASLRNGSVMGSSLRNVEPAPQILEEEHNQQVQQDFAQLPTGISEMPAHNYDDSTVGSPTVERNGASTKSDDTPTDNRKGNFELGSSDVTIEPAEVGYLDNMAKNSVSEVPRLSTEGRPETPPPRVGPKPTTLSPPHISTLPAVEGREGDLWTLPSQQPRGRLSVQNGSHDDEDDDWKKDAIMHMNLAGA